MITILEFQIILDALKSPVDGYTLSEQRKLSYKLRTMYLNAIDQKIEELNIL
jgi:hypothetical protein